MGVCVTMNLNVGIGVLTACCSLCQGPNLSLSVVRSLIFQGSRDRGPEFRCKVLRRRGFRIEVVGSCGCEGPKQKDKN